MIQLWDEPIQQEDTAMSDHLMLFNAPQGMEWLAILVIAFLIFGHRLPGAMRSLGRSVKEFKRGISEAGSEIEDVNAEITKPETKSHPAGSPPSQPKAPGNLN